MSADIILDDWALPAPIDILRNNQSKYKIDKSELDKNIQQNQEIIKRMRNNVKYKKMLQEV
ncbi:MAG: hypothetical protein NC417_06840 [Candidatus Gastranaerophilales bacterium]|nr:hypothetical protein [Candidatus Gastranaerophilales bacterium]